MGQRDAASAMILPSGRGTRLRGRGGNSRRNVPSVDGPAPRRTVGPFAVPPQIHIGDRVRAKDCKVKCATSRYLNRDDGRPAASTTVTAIDIVVRTPPLDLTPRSRRAPVRPRGPRPPTRRQRVTALLDSNPRRAWSGAELAERLQVPRHNMLTQLSEWAQLGFIARTGPGSYALLRP